MFVLVKNEITDKYDNLYYEIKDELFDNLYDSFPDKLKKLLT